MSRKKIPLSKLMESELEKAQVVIAAQSIIDQLARVTTNLSKIESDDLFPMMDSMKIAFGPQIAEKFQSSVSEILRKSVQSMIDFKDHISNEVSSLEKIVNGNDGPGNDMDNFENDDDFNSNSDDNVSFDDDENDNFDDEKETDEPQLSKHPAMDMSNEEPSGEGDNFENGPYGRPRKESIQRRGRPLNENKKAKRVRLKESLIELLKASIAPAGNDDCFGSPRERLEKLKTVMTAADYELVSQFPDNVLSLIFAKCDENKPENIAPPIDADIHLDEPHDMGIDEPNHLDFEDDLDMDHIPNDEDYHPSLPELSTPFESIGAKRLSESKNPDKLVLETYNATVKKHPQSAIKVARKIAESFGIDLDDVLQIIRESKKCLKKKKIKEDVTASTSSSNIASSVASTVVPDVAKDAKAKQLADRIKSSPNFNVSKIDDDVKNGISSIGGTEQDVPDMTLRVRKQLGIKLDNTQSPSNVQMENKTAMNAFNKKRHDDSVEKQEEGKEYQVIKVQKNGKRPPQKNLQGVSKFDKEEAQKLADYWNKLNPNTKFEVEKISK